MMKRLSTVFIFLVIVSLSAYAQPPVAFNLISPVNETTVQNDTVYVWWGASVDPDGGQILYHVQWSTHADFSSFYSGTTINSNYAITDLADQIVQGFNLEELDELPDSTRVYWRVKAVDNENDETWATPQAGWWFYIDLNAPPTDFHLLAPANGDTCWTGDTTLTWSSSSDPDEGLNVNYRVYMATDPLFTQNVTNPITGDTTHNRAGMLDDQTYYWKILATDGQPHGQTWSQETWQIHVYIPEPPSVFDLLSPGDTDTVWQDNTTLTWQSSTEPDPGDSLFYRVYWARNAAFTVGLDSADVDPPATSVNIAELSDDQTYYWKVKAIDTNSEGRWSTSTYRFRVFINEPPTAFDLQSPANFAILGEDTVTVSWTASSDPDPDDDVTYYVQWSLNENFTPHWTGSTSNTTYNISDNSNDLDELTDNALYYWRVYAQDNYNFQTWATPDTGWTFYTEYHPDPPNPFNLTSPLNGDTCWTGDTTLTWQAATDPDPGDQVLRYVVWYATDAAFTLNLDSVSVNVPTTSLNLVNLADNSTWYWKVRAQDGNTTGTWSTQTRYFHVYIPDAPGAFALDAPANTSDVHNDTVTVSWERSIDPDPGDPITYHINWSQHSNFSSFYSGSTSDTFFVISDLHDLLLGGLDELDELPDDTTIYWRVKAIDRFGNETWATPVAGWSFNVYLFDAPLAFDLVTPLNTDTCWTGDTTLVWRTTTDPDPGDAVQRYVIWWATNATFSQNLDSASVNVPDTTYELLNMLDDQTYYWSVRAQDGNTNGTWANQVNHLKVYSPEPPGPFSLSSPADGAVINDDTVTVQWTTSIDPDPDDLVTYHVQWSGHADFSSFYTGSTTETSLEITDFQNIVSNELDELPDDTTIYWRVLATDRYGEQTWATPAAGWSFDIYITQPPAPFTLLSPDTGDTCWTGDTTLTWQATSDPDPGDAIQNYVIWWATNAAFTQNLDSASVAAGQTTYDLNNLNDHTTYFWKVRAQDSNSSGRWSTDTRSFHVYIPTAPNAFSLLSPTNNDTCWDGDTTLAWQAAVDTDPNDVVHYVVWWASNAAFTQDLDSATVAGTTHPLNNRPDNSTWYWKVRAQDLYTTGTWSTQTNRFHVYIPDGPTAFNLALPADEAIIYNDTVRVHWTASADADPGDVITYTVNWSLNPGFATYYHGATTDTFLTITDMQNIVNELDELPDDARIYWRVRAADRFGTSIDGIPSSGWSFYVAAIPDPPNAFSLSSPFDMDTCWTGDTTLTWQAATDSDPGDAITYRVWWATDAAFTQNLDSASTALTTYALNGMLDDHTYWWKVRAQDTNTTGTWSTQTWRIPVYIHESPGAFTLAAPANQDTVHYNSQLVSWNAAIDPDPGDVLRYRVEWSEQNDFSGLVNSAITGNLTYTLPNLPDSTNIYWRIKAIDRLGNETLCTPNSGWSFYTRFWIPPQPFSLLSPDDGDTCYSGDTTLTWEAATDLDPGDAIVNYVVWIATNAAFTQNLDSMATVGPVTAMALNNLNDDNDYYWKVRANDTNTAGRWSSQVNRLHVHIPGAPSAFSLASPANGSNVADDSVTVSWTQSIDPDPGDTITYTVEWSTDPTFATSYTGTTRNTSYTINGLQNQLDEIPEDSTVFWRVTATDRLGLTTNATPFNGWSFTVYFADPPTPFSLLSPGNGDTVYFGGDTTLVWETAAEPDPDDAVDYVVWWAFDNTFTSGLDSVITADTSYHISGLLDDSTYYWKVRARDNNTNGTWSTEVFHFLANFPSMPEPFSLLSPLNEATVTSGAQTMTWESTYDTDPGDNVTYRIWLASDSNFSLDVDSSNTGEDTTYTFDIISGVSYWWKVRAQDSNSPGTWSDATWVMHTNVTNAPSLFALASPANDAEVHNDTVTVRWNPSVDPQGGDITYTVQWSPDALYSTAYSATTTDTFFTIADLSDPQFWENLDELPDDAPVYWRVLAEDPDGYQTRCDPVAGYRFNVYLYDPPVAFNLLSPADESTVHGSDTTFVWESAGEIDPGDTLGYVVWWALDPTFTMTVDSTIVTDTSYAASDLISNTTYSWKVRAQDSNTPGTWSTDTFIFTVENPDAPLPFGLAQPVNGTQTHNDTVLVRWNSSSDPLNGGAVTYTVEWATDPLFAVSYTGSTADTSFSISDLQDVVFNGDLDELPDDISVYWRVFATSVSGATTCSNPVNGWQFDVYIFEPPTGFSLVSPADGDTCWTDSLLVTWTSSIEPDPGDSVLYEILWDTDRQFAEPCSAMILADTSLMIRGLLDDSLYYINVHAFDTHGFDVYTDTVAVRIFIPDGPFAFSLADPMPDSRVESDTVTVHWTPSTDPNADEDFVYEVFWSLDPEFSAFFSADSITDTSYTITDLAEVLAGNGLDELPDDSTIFWRVRAHDIYDLERFADPDTGWSFTVYLPEPPETFTLLSPADGDTCWTGDTTLVWASAFDPDPEALITYSIITASDQAFSQNLDTLTTQDTTIALTNLPNRSNRFWKVYAEDNDGLGRWSDTIFRLYTFIPVAPNPFSLAGPDDNSIFHDDTVRVSWYSTTDNDPNDHVTYIVEWATDNQFENNAFQEVGDTTFLISELPNNELTNSTPDPEQELGKVSQRGPRAGRSNKHSGSAISTYSSSGSTVVSTSGRRQNNQNRVGIFEAAENQVTTGQTFESGSNASSFSSDNKTTNDDNLDDLPDGTTIYWRVYAKDRYNSQRLCNQEEGWSFNVQIGEPPAQFELLSPEDGDVVHDEGVNLLWEAAADPDPGDAVYYVVYWALNEDFSNGLDSAIAYSPDYNMTGLLNHVNYWWKVRAQDTNSRGTWANHTHRFYVSLERPPSAFNLLSPDNGSLASTLGLRLDWEEAVDPDSNDTVEYVVYLAQDEAFAGHIDSITVATPYIDIHELQDTTMYWWKVRAQDTNTTGTWSKQTYSFWALKPDPPGPFAQLAPANGDTIRTPFALLEWTESIDSDIRDHVRYKVIWATSSDLQDSVVVYTNNTQYLVTGMDSVLNNSTGSLPDDSTIFWKVYAVDDFGLMTVANPPGSGIWHFITDIPDAPVAFDLYAPADGDSVRLDELEFSWAPSFDPDPYDSVRYEVWIDTLPDFSTAWCIADGLTDTLFSTDSLQSYRQYYWSVFVPDSNTDGTWASDTLGFFVLYYNPVPDPWSGVPTAYGVPGTYPNPFNATANVVVSLPHSATLTVRIYDVLGRRVQELADGRYPEGYHKFSFNAQGLPSGVYFIHAQVSGKMNVRKKMILVR